MVSVVHGASGCMDFFSGNYEHVWFGEVVDGRIVSGREVSLVLGFVLLC